MMQRQIIGFAILGAGMSADYHRAAIGANADLGARLVAVGHHDPARYADISAQFGVPCMSEDDLLANPAVDVVSICTPNGEHPRHAINAARAGKHVLVEKPMALTTDDADRMIRACDAAGVTLGVVFQRRANLLYRRIREAIAGGDLGDLTLGIVTMPFYRAPEYYAQAAWRGTWALDGGGVLMNQGIHHIDLLLWYMGEPVNIQAHAATLHRAIEVEDTAAVTLRFENGAMATITATTTAIDGYPHRIEIYGTNGGIRTEGDMLTDWRIMNLAQASVAIPKRSEAIRAGISNDPDLVKVHDHILLYEDFIQALYLGRAPLVSGREGRRSVAAIAAIYDSAGLIPQY